jgi:ubiquinone/menaquinone biosynthesis C-methylase UbiE
VRFFDRPWLINLILYGNYEKLRDATLAEFEHNLSGRTLKVSCCYGSLTPELARRIERAGGRFDLIDVVPLQLENAQRQIGEGSTARLERMDATALDFLDASFDNVLVFFLLHELPQVCRELAMAEALRVLKPGGKIVLVDFGVPKHWNIFFRFFWLPLLGFLEPFAVPMWRHELPELLPQQMGAFSWRKESYFGGLFQKLVGTK